MTKEKETVKEIADITDEMTEENKNRHDQAKIQYPQWKPAKEGQNLNVYMAEIKAMKDFNGIGKHSVLMVCRTKNESYPMITFFPNNVCLNQFERFTTNKSYGSNFDELKSSLQTLTGRTFNIMFKGEKPASQKGFQAYKDYSVVEI